MKPALAVECHLSDNIRNHRRSAVSEKLSQVIGVILGPHLQKHLTKKSDDNGIFPKLRSTYDERLYNLQNIARRTQGFS